MAFSRDKVVKHAEDYWWKPCKDGVVWIKSQPLHIAIEAAKLKLKGYGGAFLWYSSSKLEGLFLLPMAQLSLTKDGYLKDFPDAVMVASYMDNRAQEAALLKDLKLKPPYFGLNDCTHFTSECLIQGGFEVKDEHARRGAGSMYNYLFNHPKVKVLASDAAKSDADVVLSSGLMKPADVIVYATKKTKERHHGVVYLGEGNIAMHTFHQYKVGWEDAGGDEEQLYSCFHISIDDSHSAPSATRWVGWWQLAQGPDVRYVYLGANGHMFSTKNKPPSTKATPNGPDYWFADDTTLRTCVRLTAIVEELTMSPAPKPDATPTATGTRLNDGATLTATKL